MTENQYFSLQSLPGELLAEIFTFLSFSDVLRLTIVCSGLKNLILSENWQWKDLYLKICPLRPSIVETSAFQKALVARSSGCFSLFRTIRDLAWDELTKHPRIQLLNRKYAMNKTDRWGNCRTTVGTDSFCVYYVEVMIEAGTTVSLGVTTSHFNLNKRQCTGHDTGSLNIGVHADGSIYSRADRAGTLPRGITSVGILLLRNSPTDTDYDLHFFGDGDGSVHMKITSPDQLYATISLGSTNSLIKLKRAFFL
eukprot:TRINITY_DN22928_c0_g1_i1.p1 TRINITY_DN22928_c0_g1~~TRINITY_DN22928_c0_g1_i1.p1  ORF type:complete len:253 (-),score=17.66 TRINITY_DN22928_c0_g1_i1:24-782(-)